MAVEEIEKMKKYIEKWLYKLFFATNVNTSEIKIEDVERFPAIKVNIRERINEQDYVYGFMISHEELENVCKNYRFNAFMINILQDYIEERSYQIFQNTPYEEE